MPSTACVISEKLGISNVMALDISAACTGFVYALSIAKAFIESGMKKNVLIIGAEKLSSIVDYTDRTTCMLFGDGAGAAVIGATQNKDEAIIDVQCSADGSLKDLLLTPGVQSDEAMFMQMKGNETFKIAVRTLTSDVQKIMEKNSFENDDIDLFIPHQANYRIIKAVGDALKFKDEQKVLTVHKYGNTSSASIPMAINECYEDGRLKAGATMLLDAFGGGLTWGSALVKFAPNK
jgi:3-oxoacyl-[acyl-carrier-protein] synthase-3